MWTVNYVYVPISSQVKFTGSSGQPFRFWVLTKLFGCHQWCFYCLKILPHDIVRYLWIKTWLISPTVAALLFRRVNEQFSFLFFFHRYFSKSFSLLFVHWFVPLPWAFVIIGKHLLALTISDNHSLKAEKSASNSWVSEHKKRCNGFSWLTTLGIAWDSFLWRVVCVVSSRGTVAGTIKAIIIVKLFVFPNEYTVYLRLIWIMSWL